MSGLRWGRHCVAVVSGGFLVTALVGVAWAQMKPSSAEIKTVAGQVEVQKNGEASWSPAVVGARLVEGDNVRAHAGGSARLDLPDGSTLLVAENSGLVVAKLEMDQQSRRSRRMLFHLVVGKVRAVVAKASIGLVRARQSTRHLHADRGHRGPGHRLRGHLQRFPASDASCRAAGVRRRSDPVAGDRCKL